MLELQRVVRGLWQSYNKDVARAIGALNINWGKHGRFLERVTSEVTFKKLSCLKTSKWLHFKKRD